MRKKTEDSENSLRWSTVECTLFAMLHHLFGIILGLLNSFRPLYYLFVQKKCHYCHSRWDKNNITIIAGTFLHLFDRVAKYTQKITLGVCVCAVYCTRMKRFIVLVLSCCFVFFFRSFSHHLVPKFSAFCVHFSSNQVFCVYLLEWEPKQLQKHVPMKLCWFWWNTMQLRTLVLLDHGNKYFRFYGTLYNNFWTCEIVWRTNWVRTLEMRIDECVANLSEYRFDQKP